MRRPDVVVVGAGIVGAACARELTLAGMSVTLVDAQAPGGGATAAGMGHVLALDGSPAQLALTAWSRQLWARLVGEMPDAVEPARCGTLWVAASEEELHALSSRCQSFRELGVAAELVDGRELSSMEPCLRAELPGAMWVPDDLVVYAPTATAWLVAEARARGAQVLAGQTVAAVEGGLVRFANGARLESGWVVNAAGDAALALMHRAIPGLRLRPRKGHLVITERAPGFCRHQLVEVGYLKSAHSFEDDVTVAFNLQPRRNGQVLVGSSRQLGNDDLGVQAPVLGRMLRRALEYVPRLSELVTLRAWAGLRAATDDGLPILGPVLDEPRLVLATGHEGLGITTSLASARLVADAILDRSSPIDRTAFGTNIALRGVLRG